MREELKRHLDKNEIVDFYHDTIDDTIEHFLGGDVYTKTYPALSKDQITKENSFFERNNISVAQNLNEGEYRTISYMALFYKEKVKYNPKQIVNYMHHIGRGIKEDDVTILVMDKELALAEYGNDSCECVLGELGN